MNRQELAERTAAANTAHDAADMDTIMRPYHYPKGEGKVMLVLVDADGMTEGGIIIPGVAQAKTGEAVLIDIDDRLRAKGDLGIKIGQRVQVSKYMGSMVELREKVTRSKDNGEIVTDTITSTYVTMDPSHILNVYEHVSD